MLTTALLSISLVLSPCMLRPDAVAARCPRVQSGLFDLFKESEEQKAAKEAAFREQQEILARRRDPEKWAAYERAVAERRAASIASDAELRAMQSGNVDGDVLDAWKKLKEEGKVVTTDTAQRDKDSERFGSDGLIGERMDANMPYIDQGYVDESQPDFMAELDKMGQGLSALFGKKKE